VSEVLSYTITAAIIFTSVALVFSTGFAAIDDVQQSTQNEDAERAFVQIGAKFQALEAGGAPYRAGELSVSPGRLGLTSGPGVNVTVVTPTGTSTRQFSTSALEYALEETTLTIENGAVFRTDRTATVIQSEPSLTCQSDRAVITVTTLDGPAAAVSSDLVTVIGRHRNTTLWYPTNRTGTGSADQATRVEVTVSSTRDVAWRRYLDRADGWTRVSGTSDTYACTTDRVYVRHVVIGVKFI
jgi:hypothetical protein